MMADRIVVLLILAVSAAACAGRGTQGYQVITGHGVMTMESNPSGSHLPVTLYFCVGNSRKIEVDAHGVVKLSVFGGDRVYGKISVAQRQQLDNLLLSDAYSEALRQLDPGPDGPLMCYGDPYALLTHSSRRLSYTIRLTDVDSIPSPAWSLILLMDELGKAAFAEVYKPVVPELVGATPNNALKQTVTPLAAATVAPTA